MKHLENVHPTIVPLIPQYFEMRKKELPQLKEWTQEGNLKKLQEIGHRLRGNAESYGFTELGSIGKELEAACSAGRTDEVPGLVDQIEGYLLKLDPEVEALKLQLGK